MSFRVKLALVLSSLGATVMTLLICVSMLQTSHIVRDQLRQQAAYSAEILAHGVADAVLAMDYGTVHTMVARVVETRVLAHVSVYDRNGQLIVSAGERNPRHSLSLPERLLTFGRGGLERHASYEGAITTHPIETAGVPLGRVDLMPNTTAVVGKFHDQLLFEASVGFLCIAMIVAGGWVAAGKVVRRVVQLDAGAARIADGDILHRIEIGGDDEIHRTAVTLNRMADSLLADKDALERQARTDALTGLLNRSGLAARFKQRFPGGSGVSALHIDLDRFKLINDTRGHVAGDTVLKTVAERIRQVAPEDALVARVGGDEFAMILEEAALGDRSVAIAENCIEAASRHVAFRGMELAVGASVGIAHRSGGENFQTAERLLADADIALYQAKGAGRGRVVVYDGAARAAREAEADLEVEIQAGLDRGEFIPYLQPQIDALSGALVGAETLARWCHPQRGVLNPACFLDRLRNPDLEDRVNRSVRLAALDWMSAGKSGRPPVVSLNFAAAELARLDCARDLQWELTRRGIEPGRVAIEVLEDVVIRDGDTEIERTLANMRAQGHALEFDDFGTGNSGLVNLVRLSVEQIKIDRSFVEGIDRDHSRRAIVDAMLGVGRALGVRVLAEGVETEAERDALLSLGCARMQGYVFARPMPPDMFERWVASRPVAA